MNLDKWQLFIKSGSYYICTELGFKLEFSKFQPCIASFQPSEGFYIFVIQTNTSNGNITLFYPRISTYKTRQIYAFNVTNKPDHKFYYIGYSNLLNSEIRHF